jgi:hypothetical protein
MFYTFENVVTKSVADNIESDVINRLSYVYNRQTSFQTKYYKGQIHKDENTYDRGHLTCPIYFDDQPPLPHQWFFYPTQFILLSCLDALNMKLEHIRRIKINLLQQQDFPKDHYNIAHHDEGDGYSLVYYINDSDGDTFLFNEYYMENEKYPDDLTVFKRVSPKKNTAVLFDSNRMHASSNPKLTSERCVINFTFTASKNG